MKVLVFCKYANKATKKLQKQDKMREKHAERLCMSKILLTFALQNGA